MKIEQLLFEKQKNQIVNILSIANQSDYYHSVFSESNIYINSELTYDIFSRIPVLNKSTYAEKKFHMISNQQKSIELRKKITKVNDLRKRREICEENGIYVKVTSGSTGNPLEVLKDKNDLRREYLGLNYARIKNFGKIPEGKYIWIWPANEKIREYFYTNGKVSVYKDTEYGYKYMMPEYSENTFFHLYSFIFQEGISWITAPPSMLCLFAEYLEDCNIKVKFSYIECHSEKLYDWQASYLSTVFGTRPFSVYSSNEVQFMAMTDAAHQMRIISQNSFLELIEDDNGEKKVYATSLCAKEIPIIRYCLGDVAQWKENDIEGRIDNPVIEINGYRRNDYINLRDGRRFEPFVISDLVILLNSVFSMDIKEFVVSQEDYEKLIFYFPREIMDCVFGNNMIAVYIHDYLQDVLNENMNIDFMNIEKIRKKTGTSKYKYFLGMHNG